MKKAKELKPGDKVNGHEYGWMTVLKVSKYYTGTKVRYYTMFGVKDVIYWPHFETVEALPD